MKISPKVPSVNFVPMNDRMNDLKTRVYGNEKLLAIDLSYSWLEYTQRNFVDACAREEGSLFMVLGILL